VGLDVDLACLIPLGETRDKGTWDKDTRNGGHSEASMDELCLLEVLQNLGIGTEAEGVEAVITGHATMRDTNLTSVNHLRKGIPEHQETRTKFEEMITCRRDEQEGCCPGTIGAGQRT